MIKASTITNIASPISNQNGFVLNETLLPILAPIIDPIRTYNAGNQIMLPLGQYIAMAPRAVKMVTSNDVASALCALRPILLKKPDRGKHRYHLSNLL